MDIITLQYEEPLIISIAGTKVNIVAFKTDDPRIIKFGVEAPKTITVHREEVFRAIKQKEGTALAETE